MPHPINPMGELATCEKVEAAPAEVKKPKKMDAGDEDVDIGDEMPMSTFPPVEIEKYKEVAGAISSSSSSSSSSSDSSLSSDSDSASSSMSDSEAWPMCSVLPKKMICFTASFECAASIHGRGSVAVNIVCCFILDGFLVAGQLLEEVCDVHYFVKRIPNTEELIKTMVGQKLECNVVKTLV